ncbi:MAG: LacI family transcriptional regulator [Spirochaetaceae bacterium]|jgi:LacI family transcriptional regulator|nr:LacI family transcriptional regulator [Spirochaetaceae bacterium]
MLNQNKRTTIKDVAEAAGVSVASVSHIVNGTRPLSAEVTTRILDAIKRLNYKPNQIAQNLRRGKSKVVAFIISNLDNLFYLEIARGMRKILESAGYNLILSDSVENKDIETASVESLVARGVDGLIIAPTTPDCSYLSTIVPADFPVVFVDRQAENYEADSILLFNYEAAYMASNYFISKGYKKIGFLSFHYGQKKPDKTMQERIDGYKKALSDTGIEIDPGLIAVIPGVSGSVGGLQYTESYSKMADLCNNNVRAVLCGNSLSAVGAYSYLKENNIKIPQEVSILTFDDDQWLSLTTPEISSVAQPTEQFGMLAAQRLLRRIAREGGSFEFIRLKAKLVLRAS